MLFVCSTTSIHETRLRNESKKNNNTAYILKRIHRSKLRADAIGDDDVYCFAEFNCV